MPKSYINNYDDCDFWYFDQVRRPKEIKIPAGMKKIDRPKPRTDYYHYSNEASQGALICQTNGFPDYYNPKIEEIHSAYSDRIAQWDYARLERACKIANGGEQAWAYRLPSLSIEKLKEFAKEALGCPVLPKHVRAIHYYNVATGYSCPVIEAICDKN